MAFLLVAILLVLIYCAVILRKIASNQVSWFNAQRKWLETINGNVKKSQKA